MVRGFCSLAPLKVLWLCLGGLQLLKASGVNTYLVSNCRKLQYCSEFKELLIALLIFIWPGCCCTCVSSLILQIESITQV